MLYKNGEQYKLTAADYKELKKQFRFPVSVEYPARLVKPDPNPKNRAPNKPNSFQFPLHHTLKTELGSEEWRYAERRIVGQNGEVRYQPNSFYFTGKMTLKSSDVELLYYLWKICPYVENGKNYRGRNGMLRFIDPIRDADQKALQEERQATLKALIYSNQVGLGEKKIRQVAKAYFIPKVDQLSTAQVKLAVEDKIKSMPNGVDHFMEFVEGENVLSIRESIQQAIDQEVITYMIRKKQWAWMTENGKQNIPIVDIPSGVDPHEALFTYYMNNQRFANELIASIKGETTIQKQEEPTT